MTRGLPTPPTPIHIFTRVFDSCHSECMVCVLALFWRCVMVVSGDVERVLVRRAADAGVSVDEFVDMLLRSQLWLLEDVGL